MLKHRETKQRKIVLKLLETTQIIRQPTRYMRKSMRLIARSVRVPYTEI